jgi:hypothetical protein
VRAWTPSIASATTEFAVEKAGEKVVAVAAEKEKEKVVEVAVVEEEKQTGWVPVRTGVPVEELVVPRWFPFHSTKQTKQILISYANNQADL